MKIGQNSLYHLAAAHPLPPFGQLGAVLAVSLLINFEKWSKLTNFYQKGLSRDQVGGGLRLGSKEEGTRGVSVGVCGGGCFASLVGDNLLNFD